MNSLLKTLSCAGGHDPESIPVEQARKLILDLVEPVAGTERLFVRNALGRVLAEDVLATANVPGHDNSAMDGYAVRFADLAPEGETALRLAGSAFAGRAFAGHRRSSARASTSAARARICARAARRSVPASRSARRSSAYSPRSAPPR